MEVNALAVVIAIAVLVIGPGSGVWVGMRALIKAQTVAADAMIERLDRIEQHLATLNGRVASSEGHIQGLEQREEL